MDEYPSIDSGHLCMNSLRVLSAAWLPTSQRSRGGVRLNTSPREQSVMRFVQS